MAKLPGEIARKIGRVAAASDVSFSELVKIAKLDPAQDFQGADLSGVDLGKLDISGFNFSGALMVDADLSQTTGYNERNFKGADLTNAKLPGQHIDTFYEAIAKTASGVANRFWADYLYELVSKRAVSEELYIFLHDEVRKLIGRTARPGRLTSHDQRGRYIERVERDRELLRRLQRKNAPLPIYVCLPGTERATFKWKPFLSLFSTIPAAALPLTLSGPTMLGCINTRNLRVLNLGSRKPPPPPLCGVLSIPFGWERVDKILDRLPNKGGSKSEVDHFLAVFSDELLKRLAGTVNEVAAGVFVVQYQESSAIM